MSRDRRIDPDPSERVWLSRILGSRFLAALSGMIRDLHRRVTVAYVVVFAIVVYVLLQAGFPDIVAEWIRNTRDQDAFGKIVVESPEVYTRERLVNDRLRQTVWLRKQMRATENVLKEGYFRSHEGQWAQDVATATSVNLLRNEGIDRTARHDAVNMARARVGARGKLKNGNNVPELDPTKTGASIELFRAMNEYREQIRTELMQTQLDDRHDIDGNTLYRLNFNTTVVHGRRTDALAMILVKLEHSEGRHAPTGGFYNHLLRDWAEELERRLNVAARVRARGLLSFDAPGEVFDSTEFYLWLRWRICRKLTEVAASLDGSGQAAPDSSPATIDALLSWFMVDQQKCGLKHYHRMEVDGLHGADPVTSDERNHGLEGKLDRFIGDYIDRYRHATRNQEIFWKYAEARPGLVEEIRKRMTVAESGHPQDRGVAFNSLEFYRELGRRWCSTITAKHFQRTRPGQQTEHANNHEQAGTQLLAGSTESLVRPSDEERHAREQNLVQRLCTPKENPPPPERLVIDALLDLYWRLEHLEKKLSSNPGGQWLEKSKLIDSVDCNETPAQRIAKLLKYQSTQGVTIQVDGWSEEEKAGMEQLLSHEDALACMLSVRPELWRQNLAIQMEVDQFNRNFTEGNDARSGGTGILEGIVTVEEVGCEVGLCRISVKPDASVNDPAGCFLDTLERDFEVYSYGVTPKNWRQRLAFTGSALHNMAVALEAPVFHRTEDRTGLFESVGRNQETLRSLMSRAIVIGFGRGRTKHGAQGVLKERKTKCESVSYDTQGDAVRYEGVSASGPRDEHHLSRETEFGWFIAPERRWGDGGGMWHPHRQYDLSAVISVPSWWRRVRLTVLSCWRKLSDLEELGEEYIDRCGRVTQDEVGDDATGAQGESYLIKLPGDVGEVSRKLRIGVREVPYVLTQLYNPSFGQYVYHVGDRADIVIEGGRLWRSTRVTMGTQTADEITVLPHMEGIVASFGCVRRPPYSPLPREVAGEVGNGDTYVYAVPLQVWTSEGVTTPAVPVSIVDVLREDVDPCPDDDDVRQLSKSNQAKQ